MYDTFSISLLIKLGVASLIGVLWAWRQHWSSIDTNAVLVMVLGSFAAGSFLTGAYILARYRRELTPGVKE